MKDRLNLFDLTGQKAIVTGGNQGMGREVARYFAYYGAEVCLVDLAKNLEDTARGLAEETGGVFHSVVGDLSTSGARKAAYDAALDSLGGRLDIDAVFELTQLAGRTMLPQGSGKIINFASMTSFIAGLNVVPYTASKGGVMQLTKAFSNEWAGKGIQVNAVAPGYIMTKMNWDFFHDKQASGGIFRRIAMGRWGEPEDIAAAVLFLASKAAGYMTGVTMPVDGGFLAME